MQDDDDKPNYEVGYGRPPKDKPSSRRDNPEIQGSARGSKSFKTLRKKSSREKIPVIVNGKTKGFRKRSCW